MTKLLFWVRKTFGVGRHCRRFCLLCEYYDTCKNDFDKEDENE